MSRHRDQTSHWAGLCAYARSSGRDERLTAALAAVAIITFCVAVAVTVLIVDHFNQWAPSKPGVPVTVTTDMPAPGPCGQTGLPACPATPTVPAR